MAEFRVSICRNSGAPWLGSGVHMKNSESLWLGSECTSAGILDPCGWVQGMHLQEFWTPLAAFEVCIGSMELECLRILSGLLVLLFPL